MDQKDISRYMKGTTTVGLVCTDGVVIAADSRATMDTFIASTEARKVWKIDENLGMTIAGLVGDAQELIRILKIQNEIYKMNERKQMSPRSAATLLSIILQENKMMPFYVQLIVGGVEDGKGYVYNLDAAGGYTQESRFTATGSGSLTALGYLEDSYKPGLTTKDAIKIAAKALLIAMQRDSATGNNMTIAAITSRGYEEYTQKDVEKMAK
ncbi:MAG: archaeal proteasome endopeptidase complex subunit beta [Candidatus Micrarchaeales archaeon]|jgi:20S proteasome, alpha and beta subunits|uniref:Proteasome subunit beta n=1 Tax=Candidatus Micrarchaeum acidiphilum ARMAN-2 TaxID=425595 RepID=C7DHA7_MICA2|nr:MAG: Proteasome endopeptidase complex [Candidatus Micrarchaeum acidiphilum ARMAN-2]MCW6160576.1 archaeal proteasome endopeptidase complex subunit beta [Candidatus Micrarchaeales archaeon]